MPPGVSSQPPPPPPFLVPTCRRSSMKSSLSSWSPRSRMSPTWQWWRHGCLFVVAAAVRLCRTSRGVSGGRIVRGRRMQVQKRGLPCPHSSHCERHPDRPDAHTHLHAHGVAAAPHALLVYEASQLERSHRLEEQQTAKLWQMHTEGRSRGSSKARISYTAGQAGRHSDQVPHPHQPHHTLSMSPCRSPIATRRRAAGSRSGGSSAGWQGMSSMRVGGGGCCVRV